MFGVELMLILKVVGGIVGAIVLLIFFWNIFKNIKFNFNPLMIVGVLFSIGSLALSTVDGMLSYEGVELATGIRYSGAIGAALAVFGVLSSIVIAHLWELSRKRWAILIGVNMVVCAGFAIWTSYIRMEASVENNNNLQTAYANQIEPTQSEINRLTTELKLWRDAKIKVDTAIDLNVSPREFSQEVFDAQGTLVKYDPEYTETPDGQKGKNTIASLRRFSNSAMVRITKLQDGLSYQREYLKGIGKPPSMTLTKEKGLLFSILFTTMGIVSGLISSLLTSLAREHEKGDRAMEITNGLTEGLNESSDAMEAETEALIKGFKETTGIDLAI